MLETLQELLTPLGFHSKGDALYRDSDGGRVRQVVAPFAYESERVTVEAGFFCPEFTGLALPELTLYEPVDVALCDAGLGFSFRLESLRGTPVEGYDEAEAIELVREHLVEDVASLALEYGTVDGWCEHYDRRLERWGSAMDWACWTWLQLVRGDDESGVARSIKCFAAGGRGRFGPELVRMKALYRERYGREIDLSEAETPFTPD